MNASEYGVVPDTRWEARWMGPLPGRKGALVSTHCCRVGHDTEAEALSHGALLGGDGEERRLLALAGLANVGLEV